MPTRVMVGAEDRRIKKLSCGAMHSAVITEAGHLFVFGLFISSEQYENDFFANLNTFSNENDYILIIVVILKTIFTIILQ